MVKLLRWIVPLMVVFAVIGGLIGIIFGKALVFAGIAAMLPLIPVTVIFFFIKLMLELTDD